MTAGYFGGAFGGIIGSPGGQNLLTVSLQVAFGHGPLDPNPVFTEIGTDVQTLATVMGRQHQLDRVQPSTLIARLDGRRGELSPWSTISPYYNLLSGLDSCATAGASWVATAGTYGTQSTQVLHPLGAGAAAGQLVSTGATATANTATGTSGYAVLPSAQYSASAFFEAATTAQNVSVGINWYTSAGVLIGSTVFGPAVADTTTGWTQASVTATSPANAAFAAVVVSAASSGTLVHYFDCAMFSANPNSAPIGWTLGQTFPLVPGKPVKAVTTWISVPYPVFYGVADSWTPQPVDDVNTETELKCSDVLKQLNLKYLINPTLWPNTVLASSPLAYYRMNDAVGSPSLVDSSGNGANAFVIGQMAFGSNGLVLYDPASSIGYSSGGGTPSGLATPAAFSAPATSSFTFIGTIKTTAANQIVMQFQSGVTAGNLFVEALEIDAFGLLNLSSGHQLSTTLAGPVLTVAGPLVNDGNPHWVAVTLSQTGGTATWGLRVDGVSYGTASNTFTWNGNLVIGGVLEYAAGAVVGLAPTFGGNMQDVAVFSGVLSSTVTTNLFAVGSYFQTVEYTGQRVAKALLVAGYGSYPQNLATGTVLCQPETTTVTQSLAGDYCLICNDTENGLFFQDPTGVIQFKDRHYPQTNATTTTPQVTIGDNANAPFHYDVAGLSIPADDLDLWPDVKAQRNNGVIQEVKNPAAVALYGERTLQRSGLFMNADPDVLYLAQWLNYLYAFSQIRVAAVTLSSIADSGVALPQMLGRALWDAVTMQRQGPGESPLSQMMAIESVGHNFDASDPSWKTTWQLSPFEVSAKANLALILDSPTAGILDTNVVGG